MGYNPKLMVCYPCFPFEAAHRNFYRAAKQGLDAVLLWPTEDPHTQRELSVCELASELLPIAARGLTDIGVEETEIRRMLNTIRARIHCRLTPARWQRHVLEYAGRRMSRTKALGKMLNVYLDGLHRGKPVTDWSLEA